MEIKCPRDGTVLDPGGWTQCSFDLMQDRSIYTWMVCPGSDAKGHSVSVVWIGRTPEVMVQDIVAVTPRKSHIQNNGIAPSPFAKQPPAPAWAGMPKIQTVKRNPS